MNPTPGVGFSALDTSIIGDRPVMGIVLDITQRTPGEPRFTSGNAVNVLVTQDNITHELNDVIVATGSQSSDRGSIGMPKRTDADLCEQLRAAIRGTGNPVVEPYYSSKWGDQVLVEFVSGLPFIRTIFPHPQAPAAVNPVMPTASTTTDVGAKAANNAKSIPDYMPVDTPEPPFASPPVAHAQAGTVWQQARRSGWYEVYEQTYRTGAAPQAYIAQPTDNDIDAAAEHGRSSGQADGIAQALSDRLAAGLEAPQTEQADWTEPDTDGADDTASGQATPARSTGDDQTIYGGPNGQTRVIIRADGEVIISSLASGQPIRVQAQKVILTDGTTDLVLDGATGEVRLGSDGATKHVSLWEDVKAYINTHTHKDSLSAPCSPPVIPMVDSDGKSDNVLAKG